MFAFATFAYEWVKTNLKKEEGQTMAEYGIILAVVAVLAIAAFVTLQGGISSTLNSVSSHL
jgi:pilus assembly protein Flp/PilA